MYQIEFYYTLLATMITIVTCLIMSFISLSNISFDKYQKFRFMYIFGAVAFIACLDITTFVIENTGAKEYYIFDYILNYFGFALSPLLPLLLARVLLNGKQNNWPYYIYVGYAITMAICVGMNFIFEIDPSDATYHRNIGYYILFVPAYVSSFIYLFVLTILINVRSISFHPILFIVLFTVLVGGMAIQTFNQHVHVNFLIAAIICVIFYTYITTLWAQIDGLTGLFSQYSFLHMVRRMKENEIMYVMDLNDFKQVNDTYGHVEGDRVLKEIAKIVHETFGKYGRCYRMGGDEFIAICKNDIDPDSLIMTFKDRITLEREKIRVSVAIGYASYKKDVSGLDIAKLADKAMYKDKAKMKKSDIYKAAE